MYHAIEQPYHIISSIYHIAHVSRNVSCYVSYHVSCTWLAYHMYRQVSRCPMCWTFAKERSSYHGSARSCIARQQNCLHGTRKGTRCTTGSRLAITMCSPLQARPSSRKSLTNWWSGMYSYISCMYHAPALCHIRTTAYGWYISWSVQHKLHTCCVAKKRIMILHPKFPY